MVAQPTSGWAFNRFGGSALLALDAAIVLLAVGAFVALAKWLKGRRDAGVNG
jgi:hypothetical protein